MFMETFKQHISRPKHDLGNLESHICSTADTKQNTEKQLYVVGDQVYFGPRETMSPVSDTPSVKLAG